jgi:type IV pilus assembly protein PilC
MEESKIVAGVGLKAQTTDDGGQTTDVPRDSSDIPRGSVAASRKNAGVESSRTHDASAAPVLRRFRVKQNELIFFATQLAVMLDSGVVLSDALDAIGQQSAPCSFKTIIESVAEKVKNGQCFSASLACYPTVFTPMFISIVKASEASGKMVQMLQTLSEYLNFEQDTRRQIKSALTYPLAMAIMACFAVGVMMFFVLPKFAKIYEAKRAALPMITQVLLYLSTVFQDGRKMMAVVTVLLMVSVVIHYCRRTPTGRRIVDFVKIRMPILGTMFINLVITRSMRIMATMVNTGVSLLDAVEVIRGSSNNYYFQQLWSAADKNIRDGYQLSESIEKATGRWRPARGTLDESRGTSAVRRPSSVGTMNALIGPSIVHMLRAGEKSGRLGQVSDKISVFYGKKLEASIKNVTTLVEPLMISFLGTIIGIIAIGLLLPIFRISSIIAR